MLNGIDRHVLTGDGSEPLRQRLAQVRDALQTDLNPEQAESAVSDILAEHHSAIQHASVAQAMEVQHIFAMLNQALIVLAEGSDRSVSRLSKIQESLRHTAMIRDIVALKSALADTVRFVEEESTHAREAVSAELSRLETEVCKAREFIGNTRVELAGRAEGIARISKYLRNPLPDQALYVVAYLFDRLHPVTQRYGHAVADEVMFRLMRERLQPLAPANTIYRWSPSSLVCVFSRPRDLKAIQAQVADLNRAPVLHRVALGNRTAVLTVSPSNLVAECSSDSAVLVEQLDKFSGVLQ